MPALISTEYSATVTWLGRVAARDTSMRSQETDHLTLDFTGSAGEAHSGQTRSSCPRVVTQHPIGTEIANVRQLALVSVEEIDMIARAMGLDAIDPVWLGASVVVEGLPDFSHLPPSARLQAPDGATLVVDMQNRPCSVPAREIEAEHPGTGARFKAAAKGLRGVTAWVERPGRMTVGDRLQLHIPDQRPWAHTEDARGADTAQARLTGF